MPPKPMVKTAAPSSAAPASAAPAQAPASAPRPPPSQGHSLSQVAMTASPAAAAPATLPRARSRSPEPRRPRRSHAPARRVDRRSEPRDLEAARQERQAQTAAAPIPAHPQLSLLDDRGRGVYRSNFPIDAERKSMPSYATPAGSFQFVYRRNPIEQRVASMPFNILAPPSRELFHGSHSGQHSTGGDPSRVNMDPVSATGNVTTIGGFEQAQHALRRDLSGQQLSSAAGPFAHQSVHSSYSAAAALPSLATPTLLASLRAGDEISRAMAHSIETQAHFIPISQERSMAHFSSGSGSASSSASSTASSSTVHTQSLRLGDIMGPRGGSPTHPRYLPTHLQAPRIRGAFERAQRPTGDPSQYRTSENPISQMDNALLHADMMRSLPAGHSHREEYRTQMERVERGELSLPWRHLERVQADAKHEMKSASTGRRSGEEMQRLQQETAQITGVPAGQSLPPRHRRRHSRSRSPDPHRRSRTRSRSRSRSQRRARSRRRRNQRSARRQR